MTPRILFVDDEIDINNGSGGLLKSAETDFNLYMAYYVQAMIDAGFSVTVASSVDFAIAQMRQNPFDLVLIDLMMPCGSAYSSEETGNGLRTGLKLAETVAKTWTQTKMVFLSNYPNFPALKQETDFNRDVTFLLKLDITPTDLVQYVAGLFAEGEKNA